MNTSLKVLTTEPTANLRVDCFLSLESLSSYFSTSAFFHFNKPRSYSAEFDHKWFTPINLGVSQFANTPIKVVFDLGVFVFSLVGRTKYYNNTNGETIDVKKKAWEELSIRWYDQELWLFGILDALISFAWMSRGSSCERLIWNF